MKRAASLNRLPLVLDPAAAAPLWRQLSMGLRIAIAHGRLRPGARLPSTRTLARQLAVSRTTVLALYEDVAARGLLMGSVGAGSFVAGTARATTPVQVPFRDDSGNRLFLAAV